MKDIVLVALALAVWMAKWCRRRGTTQVASSCGKGMDGSGCRRTEGHGSLPSASGSSMMAEPSHCTRVTTS